MEGNNEPSQGERLVAIPAASVTARTAGALGSRGPYRSIADERAAFERAVAEENAHPIEETEEEEHSFPSSTVTSAFATSSKITLPIRRAIGAGAEVSHEAGPSCTAARRSLGGGHFRGDLPNSRLTGYRRRDRRARSTRNPSRAAPGNGCHPDAGDAATRQATTAA